MNKWLNDLEKILLEVGKLTEKKSLKEHQYLIDWEKKLSEDISNLEKFGKEFESWFNE
ncbi:hypothetical protein ACTWQB_06200 [Piscibacillus sp. B03]|uniref:hypothetical protein n=1 Tax=Piscibacillus sp. B03 TaxID=3457430 RepID=UPI003FCD070E